MNVCGKVIVCYRWRTLKRPGLIYSAYLNKCSSDRANESNTAGYDNSIPLSLNMQLMVEFENLVCAMGWLLSNAWHCFLPSTAPVASLATTPRARTTTQKFTATTSWANTWLTTWPTCRRTMRRVSSDSSPSTSKPALPHPRWVCKSPSPHPTCWARQWVSVLTHDLMSNSFCFCFNPCFDVHLYFLLFSFC